MAAPRYLCNYNLHTHPRYVCRATWFNHQAQSSAFGGSDEYDVYDYAPINPPHPAPEVPVYPAVRAPIPPAVYAPLDPIVAPPQEVRRRRGRGVIQVAQNINIPQEDQIEAMNQRRLEDIDADIELPMEAEVADWNEEMEEMLDVGDLEDVQEVENISQLEDNADADWDL